MQRGCRHPRASRGIGLLIELLIVVIIILGGFSLYVGVNRNSQQDLRMLDEPAATAGQSGGVGGVMGTGTPQTLPGRVVSKARGEACISNLRQLRTLLTSAQVESADGSYPATLRDVVGNTPELGICPVGQVPYQYDPTTGEVKCPFPGHENY